MDINSLINDIAGLVSHPFFFLFHSVQRIYVLYLVSALVLAFWIYISARRPAAAKDQSFLQFCFPKSVYWHPSAIVDYKYFFINKIAFALFLGTLMLSSTVIAAGIQTVLTTLFPGMTGFSITSTLAVGIALTLLVVVVQDFGVFLAHYLMHKVPLLWEFHKVHHSAQTLTPMTVYRMHPVDDILTGLISGLGMGLVYGVFAFLFSGAAQEIKILHLNAVVFVFYLAGYNLRHSHIWLPLTGLWGTLFISPAHHQIHHSSEMRHTDKNMGLIFGVWDWMFGTLYIPEHKEEFRFGLHHQEDEEYQTVSALYFLPFKKAIALVRRPELDPQT